MNACIRRPPLRMTENLIEPVAQRFRALSEPQRLRILVALEGGAKPVHEIVAALDLSQPTVSRHLQALAEAGLVSHRRSGTSSLYFISDPLVFKLCDLMCRDVTRQAQAALRQLAQGREKS